MGLEKRGYMLGGSYFIDDGEDALYVEFPEGKVKYVPERTCKFVPFVEEDGSVFVENCSACDCAVLAKCRFKYCPDCGAKVVE